VAKRRALFEDIRDYQATASCFANTNKPVIAAVHGACIGGGMDLITPATSASRRRMRSSRPRDAHRMVADVGSLQRLPRLISDGVARELIFTGCDFDAPRALAIGLLNEMLPDPRRSTRGAALAQRSLPLAARRAGSKQILGRLRGESTPSSIRRALERGLPALEDLAEP